MFRVVSTDTLVPNSRLFVIDVPQVARKAKPGQFVVLRLHECGERIPLTIADSDAVAGTITIVVQAVGKTTNEMDCLRAGDGIRDVLGPLGIPSDVEEFGTVVCLGGGFGVAAMFPIARALKQAGNRVVSIIGARSSELLLWEERTRQVSDEVHITTDDGSKGRKGFVSDHLLEMLQGGIRVDRVLAIGPVPMMRAVARCTQPFGVKTMVSLNPIMLDATGLCGVCRVSIAGHPKFACVDGPEFDGHEVDWDELMARLKVYQPEERESMEKYAHRCADCRCGQ